MPLFQGDRVFGDEPKPFIGSCDVLDIRNDNGSLRWFNAGLVLLFCLAEKLGWVTINFLLGPRIHVF